MINVSSGTGIYLAKGFTDFRKSIDGLVAIVQYEYELDPYSKALFIFCNKARNKIKIVQYDHNGFWLHYKRLEKSKFIWPNLENVQEIEVTDLTFLLGGLDIQKAKGFEKTYYKF